MRLRGFRVFLWLCVGACWAAGAVRKPLGVYVHVSASEAIGSCPGKSPSPSVLHTYLQNFYAGLLADPTIAGITFGAHWDQTQPSSGTATSRRLKIVSRVARSGCLSCRAACCRPRKASNGDVKQLRSKLKPRFGGAFLWEGYFA